MSQVVNIRYTQKILDLLLNVIRRFLIHYNLLKFVTTVRCIFHFGPWRSLFKVLIRHFRPVVKSLNSKTSRIIPNLDALSIASEIRLNSFSVVGVLSNEILYRLRNIAKKLSVNDYQLIHLIDEDIYELTQDPLVENILEAYFKCKVVLLECSLVITKPSHDICVQNIFHFDYAGWESLNMFVYLSDVTENSSYHTVAKGSHRNISFRDVLRGTISDEEAHTRFGASIQNITGPAGTIFFENTEAFHKRQLSNEKTYYVKHFICNTSKLVELWQN